MRPNDTRSLPAASRGGEACDPNNLQKLQSTPDQPMSLRLMPFPGSNAPSDG